MSATHLLGIDEGTTRVTAIVTDDEGKITSSASAELGLVFPRPGWVEQDPEEIWQTALSCCQRAIADGGLSPSDIAAIGITNQRETVICWERSTGRPVAPAIVWQDRRTAQRCMELASSPQGPLIEERTGLVIDPYFSATKLEWLLSSDPEIAQLARRGDLRVGTVDSWLTWKLTAGAAHVTEPTNASRTMLMDLQAREYDDELCTTFGIDPEILPRIAPSGSVFGEVSFEHLGAKGIAVAGILGDQQAALYAQGCHRRGQAKNTYGTGSFVLANTGTEPVVSRGRLVSTVARGLERAAEYAVEGSIFATGAVVQWLRDGLGVIATANETEALAASLSDNDDVWFVPALSGLGAPYWDASARGTLLGATRGTTRAHLARAVLESIAWRTRDVLEEMARIGWPIEELRADGGAAQNSWLMQFQADISGVPVDVAEVTETTSLGALLLAGRTVGFWADDDEVDHLRTSRRRYEPSWSKDRRDEGYRRWAEAVERSRNWAATAAN